MKLLVAAVLCLTFVTVYGEIKQEFNDRLHAAGEKCQQDPKTAVDRDVLKKYLESKKQTPPPANHEAYDFCISKEMEWQKADGTIDKEFLKKKYEIYETDPTKVQEFVDECAVDKATPEETAKHVFQCIIKYAEKK